MRPVLCPILCLYIQSKLYFLFRLLLKFLHLHRIQFRQFFQTLHAKAA